MDIMYSTNWMPLFLAEQAWKCNNRQNTEGFGTFMAECFA